MPLHPSRDTSNSVVRVAAFTVVSNKMDREFFNRTGGPLGEGKLKEGIIECPWHGWKFALTTGQRVNNPNFTVACCDVRVVDGQIQIKLPAELQ